MANIYWYQSGVDAKWDTVTGNWWTDAAHTQQAGGVPATGDYVRLLGTTAPTGAPATAIALIGFDTSGLGPNVDLVETITSEKISISEGGTLIMGVSGADTGRHTWLGTTGTTGTFTFQGSSSHDSFGGVVGTAGNGATYADAAEMIGVTGNNAVFNNTGNIGGTIGTYATFNGLSNSTATTVGNYATFNDGAGATGGTVGTDATFNEASYVAGATVGARAILNGTSAVYLGSTIGDGALIATNLVAAGDGNIGTWSGTTYYVLAQPSFGAGARFTGVGTIRFYMATRTASLTGTLTTDGATPATYVEHSYPTVMVV